MKKLFFTLLLVSFIVFLACEMQKPKEEYLNLIQENKDAGNTEKLIKNYRALIKYYPDAEKIDNYRQRYIDILFDALKDDQLKDPTYATEIKTLSNSLSNDTTKVWINYRLYSYYKDNNQNEKANELLEPLSQTDYMVIAQKLLAAQKPEQTIEVYKKILDKFPDGEGLDKVHFLIAFTYSENLKDYENAKPYFQNVFEDYPESDLADDAKWMMENMEKSPEEISFISETVQEEKKQ